MAEAVNAAEPTAGPEPAYSAMSWHALFAGYGTFPPDEKLGPLPEGLSGADRNAARTLLAACATNFTNSA